MTVPIDSRHREGRRVAITVEAVRPQIFVTAVGAQGLKGPAGPQGPRGPKGDPTGVWVRGGLPPLPEPPPDYSPLWVDLDDDSDVAGNPICFSPTRPDPATCGFWAVV